MNEQENKVHEQVSEYYGKTLKSSEDLKTNACCCSQAPPKYVTDILPLIHPEILSRFYGCGSPIPIGLKGCTVLDLGCGTGRDVFIASKLVGEHGHVIGVDMTPEQINVAKKYAKDQATAFGYKDANTTFISGYIEDLKGAGIEDDSIDVVISNCVINLSPNKKAVFEEIYRVLKEGGELYFSDVFADRRLSEELKNDPVMRGECMGGSMYIDDFRRLLRDIGFQQVYIVEQSVFLPSDDEIADKVGDAKFYSCTVRAYKVPGMEESEENYGQSATYLGGISESPEKFDFEIGISFQKGVARTISSNVAAILRESRYARYFEVAGDTTMHYGAFTEACCCGGDQDTEECCCK